MTKKQKNCINRLLKRKKAFAKYVQRCLESQEEGVIILGIVSDSGEFEWLRKYENE